MIALPDDLPLLRLETGRVVRFREEWLASSLLHAARDAGLDLWWPAVEVARSVTTYLRLCHEEPTIGLTALQHAVQTTLETLGFAEIGARFVPDPPIERIALPALAQAAGPGCFILFFHLLTQRLQPWQMIDRQQIEVVGLRPAVKLLLSRVAWSTTCSGLEREIVGHIRGIIARQHPAGSLRATVS